MDINYQTTTVPIADTCTACGQKFHPGDSVTLSPPMHRHCDPMATLLDDLLTRDLATLSAQLDKDLNA